MCTETIIIRVTTVADLQGDCVPATLASLRVYLTLDEQIYPFPLKFLLEVAEDAVTVRISSGNLRITERVSHQYRTLAHSR